MQPKTSSSRLAEEPGKREKKARKYLSILSNRLPYKNCTIENIIVKFSVVTMSKIIPFIRTFCMQSLHLASS